MPIELHVIRASDFVRVDSKERLDFEESKKVLEGLASACRKRGLNRAMFDVRDLPVPDKPQFTNDELAALVETFRAAGFSRHQRLAILYRKDVHGGVRNFTFFSRMRGMQVQAFHDFESALRWLWEESDYQEEKRGTEIPVLQRAVRKRAVDFTAGINRTVVPGPARRFKRSHR